MVPSCYFIVTEKVEYWCFAGTCGSLLWSFGNQVFSILKLVKLQALIGTKCSTYLRHAENSILEINFYILFPSGFGDTLGSEVWEV